MHPTHNLDISSCESNNGVFKAILTPLILGFPLFWRLMQCLRRYKDTGNRVPHLFNALKYAFALQVVLFGAFHPR